MSPLFPRLRGLFSVTGCGGLPFQVLFGSWGFPFSCFLLRFYCLFSLCIFYLFVLCVPQPKLSSGVVLLDTWHDE